MAGFFCFGENCSTLPAYAKATADRRQAQGWRLFGALWSRDYITGKYIQPFQPTLKLRPTGDKLGVGGSLVLCGPGVPPRVSVFNPSMRRGCGKMQALWSRDCIPGKYIQPFQPTLKLRPAGDKLRVVGKPLFYTPRKRGV